MHKYELTELYIIDVGGNIISFDRTDNYSVHLRQHSNIPKCTH